MQVIVQTLPSVAEKTAAEVHLTHETLLSAEKTHDDEISSALKTAPQNDKARNLIYQWVTKRNPHSTRGLQGCPRVAWHLANQLKSLETKDGILCRRFELPKTGDHFFQHIIPQDMVQEPFPSIHSPSNWQTSGRF